MQWWLILIIFLCAAAVVFTSVLLIFAYRFTVSYFTRHEFSAVTGKRKRKKLMSAKNGYHDFVKKSATELSELPASEVEVLSRDGIRLRGVLYKASDVSSVTVICVHGYCSSGMRDMSAQSLFFLSKGYNVLLVDNRAHGKSEGNIIGFGILDSRDVLCWAEYLSRTYRDSSVYLYGVSMGASAVMMASALNLPPCVKGIVADCGFTSPYEEFSYLFRKIARFPPFLIVPLIRRFALKYAGYDIKKVDTRNCLEFNRLPVLFVHGEKDKFVPFYMTLQNVSACKATYKLLKVKDATHANCFYYALEEYKKMLGEFIEGNM